MSIQISDSSNFSLDGLGSEMVKRWSNLNAFKPFKLTRNTATIALIHHARERMVTGQ